MEETRRHQEELDALIAQQKETPAEGATAGAMYAAELKKKEAEVEAARKVETRVAAEVTAKPKPVKMKPEPRFKGGVFNPLSLPQDGEGNWQFAAMSARLMFKAGYHAEHVIQRTGVGWLEISDLPIDEEGYGCEARLKREEKECPECGEVLTDER
jgi:hypothetical protein